MTNSESIDLEFSSNILITDNSRWQLVAASQNYASNYAVYAKFYNHRNDSSIISSAEFRLLNYKATIPLGIENILIRSNEGFIKVNLFIQALAQHRDDSEPFLVEDLNIQIIAHQILHTERFLIPMNLISEEDSQNLPANEILSHRYIFFNDIGPTEERIVYARATCPETGLVDTEFFVKDGFFITKKEVIDLHFNNQSSFAPGKRCRNSFLLILTGT